tara:strand:- start:23 stop:796 length:774 start_codon:yes stop_codon:yes gene_type:complete
MSITISSIYFSPVKSISFQQISKCQIKKNIGIINDRLFAFSRLLDTRKAQRMEQDPGVRKLSNFLTLKNTPVLNKYAFEYNKGKLELFKNKKKLVSINPNNLNETRLLEKEISNLDSLVKCPIFLLKNKNKPFFDTNSGGEVMNSISLINHNSIRDIEDKISQKVEYQRFRGNFYIEGLGPWKERNLLGKIIKISGLPFRINENIPRCTATNLRPKTDKSTFNLPQKLKQFYGHSDLGVYILPLQDGEISAGDRIKF